MSDTSDGGAPGPETRMPRVLAIAWGLERAGQRGPARNLSHEAIVEAAVAIADAEGLDAVTMSRVARELGYTPMSLYRYLDTKDDLLLLMQDGVAVLPPDAEASILRSASATDADPTAGAEAVLDAAGERLRTFADGLRRIYREHPWLIDVRRGPLGVLLPGSMRIAELGLAASAGLRLDEGERIAVIMTLTSYVASSVALERDMGGQAQVPLGEDDWAGLAGAVLGSGRYPRVAPLLLAGDYAAAPDGEGASAADGAGTDADFDFGLDRLLDGLVALHERRVAADAPPAG